MTLDTTDIMAIVPEMICHGGQDGSQTLSEKLWCMYNYGATHPAILAQTIWWFPKLNSSLSQVLFVFSTTTA